MKQQLTLRPPRGQQRTQNIQIALHARHTWLVSIIITILLLLLIAGILFVINQRFLPAALPSLLFTISSILGIAVIATGILLSLSMSLVVFLFVLLWAVLTAKQRAIGRYRKAIRRSLEKRIKSYYPPKDAPQLSEDQGRHLLLLGLPGSGKTKTLENFLYQMASDPALRKDKRIPVLIQMKYYNGFFRQLPSNDASGTQTEMSMYT